jgi:outer membrane phospholipase A
VEKSDNSDIDDYRGYCDLVLTLERHESWMLSTTLRKGMSAYKGSVQVDFAYPMDRLFNAAPHLYLHVQYFAGYGETILDYDDKASSQLRLGIMLAY